MKFLKTSIFLCVCRTGSQPQLCSRIFESYQIHRCLDPTAGQGTQNL